MAKKATGHKKAAATAKKSKTTTAAKATKKATGAKPKSTVKKVAVPAAKKTKNAPKPSPNLGSKISAKKSPAVLKPQKSQKVVAASEVKTPAKAAQPTESTEKIKIDRENMTDEQIRWAELYNKYREIQAMEYDMKSTFKASAPIQHKILGWGWVLSNDNDRLEVLFQDGKRMLISNYRG